MQVIGKHDQPIRNMKFLPNHNVLVTGSWDKSVRIWDTRSPNAVANIQLTERVYAMDAKGEAIVIGTADKKLHVYNIANLGQKAGEFDSSLKYQTRTISIFHDMQGTYTHPCTLLSPPPVLSHLTLSSLYYHPLLCPPISPPPSLHPPTNHSLTSLLLATPSTLCCH